MKQISEKIIPILMKYGVSRASLFGSFARGDETEKSDVDLLVEIPKDVNGFAYIGLRMDLQEDLEKALDKRVDLVEYHLIKNSLKKYILPEQVVIYQKEVL